MRSVRIPQSLRKGDEVRIVAPASAVDEVYVRNAMKALSDLGYIVTLGKHIFTAHNQFAGNDKERLADFQEAIDDDNVKAIFCARGGYGSMRIVNQLDFTAFRKNPKWIAGFSDITVFHSVVNCYFHTASIHAPMPVNYSSPYFNANLKAFDSLLKGNFNDIIVPPDLLNRFGSVTGKLVGGNISILINLQSTPFEIVSNGNILFLEDVGEQLYHLDRMMQNLLLSGKLSNLRGLIVGGLTDMQDKKRPFGKNPNEIVLDAVKNFQYPVAFNFPAGHMENNVPFLMGTDIELEVTTTQAKISFSS